MPIGISMPHQSHTSLRFRRVTLANSNYFFFHTPTCFTIYDDPFIQHKHLKFNPFNPQTAKREEKVRVVWDTAFKGKTAKFMATRVPKLCPFVLLVKVVWRWSKTFGGVEGRDEKWSKARRWTGPYSTQFETGIQTLNLGRAAYGDILMLTWEKLLMDNILMLILGTHNHYKHRLVNDV
jgi:hypothetical protein